MEGMGWLGAIIVGAIAGWIAEQIMKSDMGLIMNIILGIVGALVMNAILKFANVIPPDAWYWQCIIGVAGACILIFGWRMISGRRTV